MTSRVIASVFALTSFVATLFAGLMAHNTAQRMVGFSLGTMIVCYAIGRVVGGLAEYVIQQHIEKYKRDFPIPDDPTQSQAA